MGAKVAKLSERELIYSKSFNFESLNESHKEDIQMNMKSLFLSWLQVQVNLNAQFRFVRLNLL